MRGDEMRRGPVTTRRIALGAVFFYTIVVGATALTSSRGRQLLQVDNAANRAAVRTARGLSQLAVVDPERVKGEGDTDALELTRWWRGVYLAGDGRCGKECEEEKVRLCALLPSTCILMRCEDLANDRGDDEFETLCAALASMDKPVTLELGKEEMVYRWRLYHSIPPRECDAACKLHKIHMCHLHPYVCQALRCEDNSLGRGGLPVGRVCAGKTIAAALSRDFDAGDVTPQEQAMREVWRLHSTLGDRECNEICKKFKEETCKADPMLCMELSCENAWSGLSDASILDICDAYYPVPGPRVPAGARRVSASSLRQEWVWLAITNPNCNKACAEARMGFCPQHPSLCMQLACVDVQQGSQMAMAGMKLPCERMELI